LLRKDTDFVFTQECSQSLKSKLVSSPILTLYNTSAETEVHTNVCSQGLGDVLLQKQETKKWAVIAYFSQTTNAAETRSQLRARNAG